MAVQFLMTPGGLRLCHKFLLRQPRSTCTSELYRGKSSGDSPFRDIKIKPGNMAVFLSLAPPSCPHVLLFYFHNLSHSELLCGVCVIQCDKYLSLFKDGAKLIRTDLNVTLS